jgi:hypothetical protein
MKKSGQPSAANVVVGRSRDGEVLSSFKSAAGRTVRVLDRDVYRKASRAAGKSLDEARPRQKK